MDGGDHRRELFRSQTDVALKLTKQLLITEEEAKDSNFVFSPLSIQLLLGLVAAGCGGWTLDQLVSFLKFPSLGELVSFSSDLASVVLTDGSSRGGPCLSSSSGAWIDDSVSLKHSFKQVVGGVFKAACSQADLKTKAVQVIAEVNSWAEKETNGLIREVLPAGSVDEMTRLIFASALYFKGTWSEKFDASQTKDYNFHLQNGSSTKAPFMTSTEKQIIRAYDGFKALRLQYQRGEDDRCFSMYIFLPDANDGMPALVHQLSSEPGFLEKHLPFRAVEVGDFRIPKFKASFGFEASQALKGLGLVLPFSAGGLTEMVDDESAGRKLYVSGIFQKSFIEVNEEGTEAAAVSAAVCSLCSFEYPIDFVADHPFLYIIREDTTGSLLFIGQMMNPAEY